MRICSIVCRHNTESHTESVFYTINCVYIHDNNYHVQTIINRQLIHKVQAMDLVAINCSRSIFYMLVLTYMYCLINYVS